MYTLKEMKFPILITLDESGINKLGQQIYKIEIQDSNLETMTVEYSDLQDLSQNAELILRNLLNKNSKITDDLPLEEKIIKYPSIIDAAYHEGVRYSLQIVNSLISDINMKSTYVTGNTYILTITPMIEYFLKDWFELWGQPYGTYYDIVGNKIFVLVSKDTPSICEGNKEQYIEKTIAEEIYEHEYYKSESPLDYSFKMLGYKKTPEG